MNTSNIAAAHSLDVPSFLSIQYPLRVKNVEKAVDMVGGSKAISRCFIEPDSRLELRLRPNDPYAHPISSEKHTAAEDVLLKVSIPKKVLLRNNRDIRKALQDCEENGIKYKVIVHGTLNKVYKFRQLADFQVLHRDSKFTNTFLQSVGEGDLSRIKDFAEEIEEDFQQKDKRFRNEDLDIPPLLRYARVDIPYNYKYVGSVLIDENGELTRDTVKLHTIFVDWGVEPPTTYAPVLQKELDRCKQEVETLKEKGLERLVPDSPSFNLLQNIEILNKLFSIKPVWLRRHISWMIPARLRPQLRFALPYVAYTTKKGPWRQSYIRLGYNPMKDPKAVDYQVEAFRVSVKALKDQDLEKMIETGEETLMVPRSLYSHIGEFSDPNSDISRLQIGKLPRQLFYDGMNPTCAVSFQIGDIMDKDVRSILKNAKLSEQCYETTGWLDWVSVCRIRGVMKYKLDCIDKGRIVDESKVAAIMKKTNFPSIDYKRLVPQEEGEDEDEEEGGEEEVEGGEEEGGAQIVTGIAKEDLVTRLKVLNPNSSKILDELNGLIKQEDVMSVRANDERTNNERSELFV